ncbi:MAG: hypothetical protein HYW91_00210 [Candidatus Sungbacteria bacterium]|nr:hypothetical protein [Candidatus Sungbacteria bacterium]
MGYNKAMGKLEELEEELYGKEEGKEVTRRMGKRVFFPGALSKISTRWPENGRPKDKEGYSIDRRVFRFFLWGLAVVGAAGAALFLFLYLGTRGQEAEIVIHGRERVEAGEVVNIPIVIRNVSGTVLREAELAIIFPEGFLILDDQGERQAPPRFTKNIPDIAPDKETQVEITVRIFGRESEEKNLEASLIYRPENLRARFSAKTSYTFVVSRVPLAISWEMPEVLSAGQDLDFEARYSSTATGPFKDLSLRLDYPPGFIFISASPEPSVGTAIWDIGTLDPDRQGSIKVRGKISGGGGEVKTFVGGLGKFDVLTKEWKPYSESSREAKIFLAPLSIDVSLDGAREQIISPGERLNFTLRYRNNTDLTLKNVSVEARLEGTIVEFGTITPDAGGVFDGSRNVVLWGPGGTQELREVQPGGEGTLRFGVSTKERPPVRGKADQNLTVRLRSVIETKTVPRELVGARVGSETALELKVRSKIIFAGRALYRGSALNTSGPLPPKVGIKTSYAVLWEMRNFTNNLENVEVKGFLPPNVVWENIFSKDAQISFDQQSGEIRWRIREVKAGTGVLSPALTSAFLVSILPSEADVGQTLTLLRDVKLTARDTFTGEDVEVPGEALTTELKDDITTTNKDWAVVR